jgi:hypothetical protein
MSVYRRAVWEECGKEIVLLKDSRVIAFSSCLSHTSTIINVHKLFGNGNISVKSDVEIWIHFKILPSVRGSNLLILR